ncbi:MAG: hypothetical protein NT016_03655 [Candidatus Aenigmarchaeota archaeon]|nr:hypothetical protein [Candidatus Aenigmarchaeota archaeon]
MADAAKEEPNPNAISFDLIRRIQREEQRVPKLTKLPEGFYDAVRLYLHHKRETDNRKSGLETKQVERLAEDIYNRRERKIFNIALIAARTRIPPENLTEEETLFFDQVVYLVKDRRQRILDTLVTQEASGAGSMENLGLVVFKEEVPAFVGADMRSYGPFKKGDIAKLPEENRIVLLQQNIVEEFTINR